MKQLAATSIVQESIALEFELLQTIDLIGHLTDLRESADKAVARIMKELNSPLLSVPGIGVKLGAVILAVIRSINNFKTPDNCLPLQALSLPSTLLVKIERRTVIWLIAVPLNYTGLCTEPLDCVPSMRAYYQKKLDEGKHYHVAVSHVAKKLVRIIFRILKTNEPYQEDKMIVN